MNSGRNRGPVQTPRLKVENCGEGEKMQVLQMVLPLGYWLQGGNICSSILIYYNLTE